MLLQRGSRIRVTKVRSLNEDKRNDKTYMIVLMYYYYRSRHSKLDLYLQQTSTQEKSERYIIILYELE
jgi:hypothetical protein